MAGFFANMFAFLDIFCAVCCASNDLLDQWKTRSQKILQKKREES